MDEHTNGRTSCPADTRPLTDHVAHVEARDAQRERDGLLDPGQPTEAAHLRYAAHPEMQALRADAREQMRRERQRADLRARFPDPDQPLGDGMYRDRYEHP